MGTENRFEKKHWFNKYCSSFFLNIHFRSTVFWAHWPAKLLVKSGRENPGSIIYSVVNTPVQFGLLTTVFTMDLWTFEITHSSIKLTQKQETATLPAERLCLAGSLAMVLLTNTKAHCVAVPMETGLASSHLITYNPVFVNNNINLSLILFYASWPQMIQQSMHG